MKEIERKFLVNKTVFWDEFDPDGSSSRICQQSYLSFFPCVRVRIDSTNGKGYLTVKGPGLLEREEFEYEVPVQEAQKMMEFALGPGISKVRYDVKFEGKLWEVDFFHRPSGLAIAEVELKTADEKIELPKWVTREVTDDPSYSNAAIAKKLCATSA